MRNDLKHPFNVMRHRDWDNAPRMPQVFAAAFTALGVTGTVSILGTTVALSTVLGYVAYTAVSMLAMRALAPDLGKANKGTQVNARSSIADQEYVYGQVRKGGTIAHMEATGVDNKYLHIFVALAGHEVDEIGDIYLNDQVVTLDANGFVTSQDWNSKVFIKKFTGTSSQTVFDSINALSGTLGADGVPAAIDTNFKGRNIACVYMRLQYDQNAFSTGVPTVTAVVKGRKIYDPRTSTTAWSDNAALCIRDYITQSFGLADSAVNDTYFSAAANDCDDAIPLAAGGSQARYTINGVVSAGVPTGQTLNDMISACNGSLFYSGGEWRLKVGVYTAPVKTFTLDDLRSEIDLPTRISRRDNFNRVVGKFIKGGVFDATTNPDGGDWIETEYPALESAAFTNEDNGIENTLDLPLYFVTNAARAQRIAKQTLFRNREQISFSAEFGMNAMGVEVGDIVALTIDEYGWSGKTFEVASWKLFISQEGGVRVAMTLRETSAAAFDWDAEETDLLDGDTYLTDPNAGLAINNLTATGGGRTQGDGTFINSVILNWDDVTNAFLDYYDVEWKATADSTYNSTTASVSDIELSPLVDGVQYMIRVRAVTNAGVRGDWATITFTGGGDVTAPGLPTGISATGHFKYISVSWTNPADSDLNYVEVYENTTNSTTGAVMIGISSGDNFVRTDLGLDQTLWYFLKAVDYSGNKSAFTAGVSATTTYLDDPDFENGIYTLFKDQGLYAIRDVTGLPTSGAFTGEKVFNRTDGKLYQWTGSAWELVIAEADSFAAYDKIIANTITGGLLATSGIITNSAQIGSAVITEAKIADLAVDTIKIANGAITSSAFTNPTVVISSSYTTVATINLATDGGYPLLVQAGGQIYPTSMPDESTGINGRLYINGTLVKTITTWIPGIVGNNTWAIIPAYFYGSTSASGTTTVILQLAKTATTGTVTSYPILYAQEIKR